MKSISRYEKDSIVTPYAAIGSMRPARETRNGDRTILPVAFE